MCGGCLGVTRSILEPLTLAEVVTLQRSAQVIINNNKKKKLQSVITCSKYLLDFTNILGLWSLTLQDEIP